MHQYPRGFEKVAFEEMEWPRTTPYGLRGNNKELFVMDEQLCNISTAVINFVAGIVVINTLAEYTHYIPCPALGGLQIP